MEESPDEQLRTDTLGFVGALVAASAHEYKNHLAVIKESAGLLGDLANSASTNPEEMRRRVKALSTSISNRVDQAALLATVLNHFAHRADRDAGSFDPAEAVAEVVTLMRRFARQRHIELEVGKLEAPSSVSSDPFLLQFVIFRILGSMVKAAEGSGTIRIAISGSRDGLEITFTNSSPVANQMALEQDESSSTFMALARLRATLHHGRLPSGGYEAAIRFSPTAL